MAKYAGASKALGVAGGVAELGTIAAETYAAPEGEKLATAGAGITAGAAGYAAAGIAFQAGFFGTSAFLTPLGGAVVGGVAAGATILVYEFSGWKEGFKHWLRDSYLNK